MTGTRNTNIKGSAFKALESMAGCVLEFTEVMPRYVENVRRY